eukprot:2201199-Prymnesium_polylepis.2
MLRRLDARSHGSHSPGADSRLLIGPSTSCRSNGSTTCATTKRPTRQATRRGCSQASSSTL